MPTSFTTNPYHAEYPSIAFSHVEGFARKAARGAVGGWLKHGRLIVGRSAIHIRQLDVQIALPKLKRPGVVSFRNLLNALQKSLCPLPPAMTIPLQGQVPGCGRPPPASA